MKKTIIILIILCCGAQYAVAQSIVGAWKTVSTIVEDLDGKTRDMVAMQWKHFPCMAGIETVFEAGGKQITKGPAHCGPLDYSKLGASIWKMNGNQLSITNEKMPTPLGTTATYTVAFAGNKVMLTHEYTAAEKQKLTGSTKLKKIVITYQRI